MRRFIFLSVLFAAGCAGDPVGDPCLPEQVPEDLASTETYLELSSPQCVTRACIVRGLRGDPRPGCTEGCADEAEIAETVYCTCRCDGPAACACPDGFVCEDVEAHGRYCVRDRP